MIYVTGGSGFLGKNLLRELKGDVVSIPYQEIPTLKFKPFDKFYFLSTYGNMHFHEENGKIWQANVSDLLSVLNKVSKFQFKSFVFISTSSVKLRIQTMYSRSKKAAEEMLLSYMEKYRLPICVIRPTSLYGKREQPQHLIPTILRSCFKGEPMNFVEEPVHDYIFIDDVVDGIMNLSQHSAKGIFELGTGIKTSNKEVLELIEEITRKKANINLVDSLRDYDNTDWVATNYKARSYGWLPKTSLKDGLKTVVEDYINNPKNYDK